MSANSTALLFPGQGSQYPGIGKDLYQQHQVVRDTYAEASEAVGYDIAKLSFQDPDNVINLTRYTQPVLLTHSIACLRAFNAGTSGSIQPALVAGHSLGEYSALVAAGVLSFSVGLKLVKKRGELMAEFGAGEMLALMLDLESATALAQQHYCGIAACNLPQQTVVAGKPSDLDALTASMAQLFPRKRSARLKTEGAFHTYYMVEAARRFRAALEQADFAAASCSVLSNFTGGAHADNADSIRSRLFMQLINPVLWHQNLLTAAEHGATAMIEFGGGLGNGETAAEKRPNLETMVHKTFQGSATAPAYHAVINQQTLQLSVAAFA